MTLRGAGWGLMAFLALGVALYAALAYSLLPLGAAVHPDMRAAFQAHPVGIGVHVFASLFAATVAIDHVPTADADAQPKMKAALAHLQKAHDALQKASSDKGGHRVKALDLTKQAIEQVKQGIAFDNKK